MNLFYPNSLLRQSYLRASIVSFPRISAHRARSNLFLGCHANSVRVEFNGLSGDRSNGGDKIESTDKRSDEIVSADDCMEVILVGSRKDAILDFCAASPYVSPALRFWNIVVSESEPARLQQRFIRQECTAGGTEDFFEQQSSCKAFALVASAAYGSDHITSLDVLGNINSENALVVGIILKPFSFEGQRRQNEVKDLFGKLQKCSSFCIVLDTDMLLENDMVTLDEALSTSNNAVLMALNAISIIVSERYTKLLNKKDNSTRELQLTDFREIFGRYKEARIGFGIGYNVKASILRSINDCPFLGVDVKDIDGVVLCIFARSDFHDHGNANKILPTVRQVLGFNGEIIVSMVHEPNLEPNAILTTVIALGHIRQKQTPRNSILSHLGQHFPFIFNIFKKTFQLPSKIEEAYSLEKPHATDVVNLSVIGDMFDANSSDCVTEKHVDSFKTQPEVGMSDEESCTSSFNSANQDFVLFESSTDDISAEGPQLLKRELLTRGNLGNGHLTQSLNYEANFSETSALVESINIYKLPVGVKHLEKYEDSSRASNQKQGAEGRVDDNKKKPPYFSSNVSLIGLMETGDFSLADSDNSASVFKKGNSSSNSKKQGGLSVRAASMLESERVSEKKWNRVVEMKYRGGIYKGRAQGGLPEGKGRLLLGDGSFYDGMWRYGKRSGLGTFCFNNGDVFQGSWRDDAMHGKGWFYFRTGDRWFANFWKGKAYGEGRFYSKLGDVSFGQFKEGWRHGYFLRINVDGTRTREVWDEGVLVSDEPLD